MFIGIDGGQTKTVGVLADESGTILAEKRISGMPFMGELTDEYCCELKQMILDLCEESNTALNAIDHICGGLCGVDTVLQKEEKEQFLSELFGIDRSKLTLVNDGITALWGATESEYSIILQHGTAFTSAFRNGNVESAVFDCTDIGRIFDIRDELLVAAARMIDGRRKETPLLRALLDRFNITNPADFGFAVDNDIVPLKDQKNTVEFLFDHWQQGDETAIDLIESAIEEYVLMSHIMLKKIDSPVVDVVFGGGVLDRAPDAFLKRCEEKLRVKNRDIEIVRPKREPAYGAVQYAMHCKTNK